MQAGARKNSVTKPNPARETRGQPGRYTGFRKDRSAHDAASRPLESAFPQARPTFQMHRAPWVGEKAQPYRPALSDPCGRGGIEEKLSEQVEQSVRLFRIAPRLFSEKGDDDHASQSKRNHRRDHGTRSTARRGPERIVRGHGEGLGATRGASCCGRE